VVKEEESWHRGSQKDNEESGRFKAPSALQTPPVHGSLGLFSGLLYSTKDVVGTGEAG
jgi:hypothetical protein